MNRAPRGGRTRRGRPSRRDRRGVGLGKVDGGRTVADALGLPVLDTGAMYRAVTLAVLETASRPRTKPHVWAWRRPSSSNWRTAGPCSTAATSARRSVVRRSRPRCRGCRRIGPCATSSSSSQREWVLHHGGGVVEGRDIGTVVFPAAPVKVFLVADVEERARRRQRDEHAADRDVAVDEVQAALDRRDAYDSSRAVSPLRAADDALVIDSTRAPLRTSPPRSPSASGPGSRTAPCSSTASSGGSSPRARPSCSAHVPGQERLPKSGGTCSPPPTGR